jgi:hypothetical protein
LIIYGPACRGCQRAAITEKVVIQHTQIQGG